LWLNHLYSTIETLLWYHDYNTKRLGSGGTRWQQTTFYPSQFKLSRHYRSSWHQNDINYEKLIASDEYKQAFKAFKSEWNGKTRRSFSRLSLMYDKASIETAI
jgi:hypothetical protein